jgi:hypothetical protein
MHSSFEAYSAQIGEKPIRRGSSGARFALERDDFSSRWHPALVYWWSMISSENRHPLFGIML